MYFEAWDLLSGALEERFSSQRISSVLVLETILLRAANSEDCDSQIKELQATCFKDDLSASDLAKHLPLLQDVIKKGTPMVMSYIHSHYM